MQDFRLKGQKSADVKILTDTLKLLTGADLGFSRRRQPLACLNNKKKLEREGDVLPQFFYVDLPLVEHIAVASGGLRNWGRARSRPSFSSPI